MRLPNLFTPRTVKRPTALGTAALCMAAAFAVALVVLLVWRTALPVSVLAALVAALAERVPGAGLDNLALPLATASALTALS